MPATWVLVCDASRARVFDVGKKADPWKLVEKIDHPQSRSRTSELVSDRPGRVRQSGTGASPAMAASTDPADVEAGRFASELGHYLQHAFDVHRFERLFVVAPPRFLGMLRKEVSVPVGRCVVATLDKDYSQVEARDLEKRMSSLIYDRLHEGR